MDFEEMSFLYSLGTCNNKYWELHKELNIYREWKERKVYEEKLWK